MQNETQKAHFKNIKLDIAISELLAQAENERKAEYPADHKAGMAVPKGGSSCANCKFYKGDMKCGSEYFIKWNGSENIPADEPDEYCSDWFMPKEENESEDDN